MSALVGSGFLRQLGWKTFGELLTRILSLGFFFVLARVLGDTYFGLYSWPLALAGFLSVILDPGSHSLLIREVARSPEQQTRILQNTLVLRGLASFAFLGLILLILPLNQLYQVYDEAPLALLAASLIMIGQSWLDTWSAWLNAHQEFKQEARIRFVLKVFVLIPPLICLWYKPSILCLLWSSALAHLLCLPLFVWSIRRHLHPGLAVSRSEIHSYWRQGLGFWMANISWILYLKLDLVMLPLLGRSPDELAWYQVAIRFYEIVCLGGYLLSMTLFPRLSALADQKQAFEQLTRQSLKLTSLAGCLAAVSAAVLSFVLPMALGSNYAPVVSLCHWLCWSIPLVYLNLVLFNVLGAQHQQQKTAYATTLCLLFNGLCNLYAIPRWGAQGAAISTLLADSILCLSLLFFLHRTKKLKN